MVVFTTIIVASILGVIIQLLQNLKIRKYQKDQLNQRLLESDTDRSRIVNFYTPYSDRLIKCASSDNVIHLLWKKVDNKYLKRFFVINFEKRQKIIQMIKHNFRQFQKENKEMNKEHTIKFNSVNYGFISEFLLSVLILIDSRGVYSTANRICFRSSKICSNSLKQKRRKKSQKKQS